MSATAQEAAFDQLHEALQDSNYKKALKCADAVLAVDSKDEDALAVKTYALIKLERYSDASQSLVARADQAANTLWQAYCVWKDNGASQALQLLQKAPDEGSQHLRALLLMRVGEATQAAQMYQTLLQGSKGDRQSACELITNTLAALVMAGQEDVLSHSQRLLKSAGLAETESFEIAFNLACSAIAVGDNRAQMLLDTAHTRGQESLVEDDATEEEMDKELAVVRGQQAYLACIAGDTKNARETLSDLLELGLNSDPSAHAACSNNAAALDVQGSKGSAKDAQRTLQAFVASQGNGKFALSPELVERLTPAQRAALLNNALVLSLCGDRSTGKRVDATSSAAALQEVPASSQSAEDVMVAAAATARSAGVDVAIESLETWCQGCGEAATLQPILLAAHLACNAQPPQPDRAVTLLQSELLPAEVRHSPALVATRVRLLEQQASANKASSAQKETQTALHWWQEQGTGDNAISAQGTLLQQLAKLCMASGDSMGAAAALGRLQKLGTERFNPATLAQLARGLAVTPADNTERPLKSVRSPPAVPTTDREQAEKHDVAFVRSKGTSVHLGPVTSSFNKVDADGDSPMDNGSELQEQKKRKRKRKPRYPKDFDPDNPGPPPDPERWLPKHERSAFKKRRKGKGKGQPVSKGAQGLGKVDTALDSSNVKVDESASTSGAGKAPSRSGPRGAQSKRKGRR